MCVALNEYKLTDDSSGMSLSGQNDWRNPAYITRQKSDTAPKDKALTV